MDITTRINNFLLQSAQHIEKCATTTLLKDAAIEIEKLNFDKKRIDWLADIENTIGNLKQFSVNIYNEIIDLDNKGDLE